MLGYQVTLYPLAVPDEPWDEAYSGGSTGNRADAGRGGSGLARRSPKDRAGYYDVMMTSRPHNMRTGQCRAIRSSQESVRRWCTTPKHCCDPRSSDAIVLPDPVISDERGEATD